MRKLTRRELLKVSLGTMGALALANLPNWNKPAMRVGVLPAHAQTSVNRNDLLVTVTWDTGGIEPDRKASTFVNIDNHVDEPNYGCVYSQNPDGPTAHLVADNFWGFGPEIIYVAEGNAAEGHYYIYVGFVSGQTFPTTVTIKVQTLIGKPAGETEVFTYVFESDPNEEYKSETNWYYIATAEFPSGDIFVEYDYKGTHKSR